MKRLMFFITTLALAFTLVACTKSYTVSFDLNGGEGSISLQEINEGNTVTKPSDPSGKEGYTFRFWSKDGSSEYDFSKKVNSSFTLKALWIKDETSIEEYSVVFDLNGGSGSIDDQIIEEGNTVTKPSNPVKDGFTFKYWSQDSQSEYDFDSIIDSDITLVAIWEESSSLIESILYTIDFGETRQSGYDSTSFTFTNGDGSEYTLNKQRAQIYNQSGYDEMFLVLSPRASKNTMSYVELDLTNIEAASKIVFNYRTWKSTNVSEIQNFTDAYFWIEKKVNDSWIKMDLNSGGNNLTTSVEFDELKQASFILDGAGLYRIVYNAPSVDSNGGNTDYAINIPELSVYHLVDSVDSLNITFDYSFEGMPNKVLSVIPGELLSAPDAPERDTHNFVGWYKGASEYDFNTPVNSEFTLTARWERSSYKLTYDYGFITSGMIEDRLVEAGSNAVVIEAPVREGYSFAGWYNTENDEANLSPFDFENTAINSNLRLIGKWIKTSENPNYNIDDVELDTYYQSLKDLRGKALFDTLRILLGDANGSHEPVDYGEAKLALAAADAHPEDNSKVLTIYDRNIVDGPWNHPNWNREHVWPNSKLGIERVNDRSINQGSDLHNLRAIIPSVNSSRSNRYFVNPGDIASPIGHTISDDMYYPGDEDKGDVARILLYMAVRYEELNLTDDQTLLNGTNYVLEGAYMGKLSILLDWHLSDPVDDFEINRNNVIYSYQNNRNPFIDHPELFEEVYNHLLSVDEARGSVSFVVDNKYVINIDYSFFKRDKNNYIA